MVIGSGVSVFLKDKLHGLLRSLGNKKLCVLGFPVASALGIASPLCTYGTIPIVASFSKSGVKDDWLAAFMMSSILLNPQLIIYSAALGQAALIIRIASCFLCGTAAGLLIRCIYRGKSFFTFDGFEEPKSRDTDPNLLLRYFKNLWRNLRATGLYFLPASRSPHCLAATRHGVSSWRLRSAYLFTPAAAEPSHCCRDGFWTG